MELHTPGYCAEFRCLAARCPHTCCAMWEVPVDRETADFYRTVPGQLGDRLRSALTPDEDGQPCFRLTGGKCAFLDPSGLCSLQLRWGEGTHIPAICREHPRFSYDYGAVREEGLCASCPEAARLVLDRDLVITSEPLPGGGPAHPLLAPLLSARETALALLRADAPLPQRLRALLLLGNDLQTALDEDEPAALEDICILYSRQLPVLEGASLPSRRESLTAALICLKDLERLDPAWTALLDAALAALSADRDLPLPPPILGRRAAAYFLYRHWLRALNDGDLLTWCELAVLGAVVPAALAPATEGGFAEAFRRFCLEVEHSQPNLDALQDALWHTLTLSQLLALAGTAASDLSER